MKNVLLILLVVFSLNLQAQEAKKYAVKSGYVKYELSGNTTGTKELWWDDYGQKTCEVEKSTTTTKMFGIKNTEKKNMCTVLVKDKFWVADYIEGSGTTGTVPFYQEGQDFANSMTEKEQEEFADQILVQMGGEKQGTETLGGYKCDIIKIMGAKSWIYKGISLKIEAKVMGIESNEMFTDFKPNTKVSASKFDPPPGVNFKGMPKQSEMGGLGGLMSAFGDMPSMEEEEDDDILPVNYEFDKFKEVVDNCQIDGYKNFGAANSDGVYVATFMKGMQTIAITLQADRNIEDNEELESFGRLSHRERDKHYAELTEENGTGLLVEYPSQSMVLLIVAMPSMSKDKMLEIEKKLRF